MTGEASARILSLLDYDEELRAAVPAAERATARRALVGRLVVAHPGESPALEAGTWSAYLAEGVMVRMTRLGPAVLPELIGPREVVAGTDQPEGSLPLRETVYACETTYLIVFGSHAARAIGHWTEVRRVLERRVDAQRRRAAAIGAIAQLPRVHVRLLAALWHFADEWGVADEAGTVLPFPLTHATLGRFVGARRSTVTLALNDLRNDGLVLRREDGTWLLCPGSAAALHEMLGDSEAEHPLLPGRRLQRGS